MEPPPVKPESREMVTVSVPVSAVIVMLSPATNVSVSVAVSAAIVPETVPSIPLTITFEKAF